MLSTKKEIFNKKNIVEKSIFIQKALNRFKTERQLFQIYFEVCNLLQAQFKYIFIIL